MAIPSAEVRSRTGRILLEGVADLTEIGSPTIVCRIRGGYLPTPIGGQSTVKLVGGGGLARIDGAD